MIKHNEPKSNANYVTRILIYDNSRFGVFTATFVKVPLSSIILNKRTIFNDNRVESTCTLC